MVAVPVPMPVTRPVVEVTEPIVATEVLLLLHVWPAVVEVRVVVLPVHTLSVPVIVAGRLTTETANVRRQPVESV